MNIQCRLFGMPETTQMLVEPVELDHAPDVYCKQHRRCTEGDVYFVQVWTGSGEPSSNAELWRCEVAAKEGGVLMLFTVRATEEEMLREIKENEVSTNPESEGQPAC